MKADEYAAAAVPIAPQSELSIARGGEKIAFPDFTREAWKSTPKFEVADFQPG